jgi:hypothetical protein
MVSNFVRIRKQFGPGWFFIHLLFYFIEIPFFFLLILFSGASAKGYTWSQFSGFCKNVWTILSRAGTILSNRPHFYKLL